MENPCLRIEDTGEVIALRSDVTTVGRGAGADIRLDDPSVSRLHAEIVRRGPYFYIADLGLSRNGTRVNGRPVARRVLDDGDVLTFGSARCRIEGLPREELAADAELRRSAAPRAFAPGDVHPGDSAQQDGQVRDDADQAALASRPGDRGPPGFPAES